VRPRLTLDTRIAKGVLLPVDEIAAVLPHPGSNTGACWFWRGKHTHGVPIMKWEGKPTPVRRVLHGAFADNQRVYPSCAGFLCVNPDHSKVRIYNRIMNAKTFAVPEPEHVTDTVDDVAYVLYQRDPPWNAAEIAAEFDFEITLVEQAIAGVEAGEL
jgi:hypothetical protein